MNPKNLTNKNGDGLDVRPLIGPETFAQEVAARSLGPMEVIISLRSRLWFSTLSEVVFQNKERCEAWPLPHLFPQRASALLLLDTPHNHFSQQEKVLSSCLEHGGKMFGRTSNRPWIAFARSTPKQQAEDWYVTRKLLWTN
jgi:hypothetical protein